MPGEETFNKIQKGTCSLGEISKHVVLTAKQDMSLGRKGLCLSSSLVLCSRWGCLQLGSWHARSVQTSSEHFGTAAYFYARALLAVCEDCVVLGFCQGDGARKHCGEEDCSSLQCMILPLQPLPVGSCPLFVLIFPRCQDLRVLESRGSHREGPEHVQAGEHKQKCVSLVLF